MNKEQIRNIFKDNFQLIDKLNLYQFCQSFTSKECDLSDIAVDFPYNGWLGDYESKKANELLKVIIEEFKPEVSTIDFPSGSVIDGLSFRLDDGIELNITIGWQQETYLSDLAADKWIYTPEIKCGELNLYLLICDVETFYTYEKILDSWENGNLKKGIISIPYLIQLLYGEERAAIINNNIAKFAYKHEQIDFDWNTFVEEHREIITKKFVLNFTNSYICKTEINTNKGKIKLDLSETESKIICSYFLDNIDVLKECITYFRTSSKPNVNAPKIEFYDYSIDNIMLYKAAESIYCYLLERYWPNVELPSNYRELFKCSNYTMMHRATFGTYRASLKSQDTELLLNFKNKAKI